jgi:hypothetical protein
VRLATTLAVAALLLVGCGDDDDDAATGAASSSAPSTTVDPVLGDPGDSRYPGEPSLPDPGGAGSAPVDVAAAIVLDDGTEVRVAGHLIALPDGTATLCGGAIAESAPPQCAAPALPVDGLIDAASLMGVTDNGTWVEGDVVLEGTLQGGRLRLT